MFFLLPIGALAAADKMVASIGGITSFSENIAAWRGGTKYFPTNLFMAMTCVGSDEKLRFEFGSRSSGVCLSRSYISVGMQFSVNGK